MLIDQRPVGAAATSFDRGCARQGGRRRRMIAGRDHISCRQGHASDRHRRDAGCATRRETRADLLRHADRKAIGAHSGGQRTGVLAGARSLRLRLLLPPVVIFTLHSQPSADGLLLRRHA